MRLFVKTSEEPRDAFGGGGRGVRIRLVRDVLSIRRIL